MVVELCLVDYDYYLKTIEPSLDQYFDLGKTDGLKSLVSVLQKQPPPNYFSSREAWRMFLAIQVVFVEDVLIGRRAYTVKGFGKAGRQVSKEDRLAFGQNVREIIKPLIVRSRAGTTGCFNYSHGC